MGEGEPGSDEGSGKLGRGKKSFTEEVTSIFGVLPNFFRSAPSAEALVEQLWEFAKAGYLQSPLPSVFKERLFVHLSRFCEVRYCIVRHVGFLIGQGRPAGDPTVVPQTVEQVLALLQRPLPDAAQLGLCLERLEQQQSPVDIPGSGTPMEGDVFEALTIIFLEPQHSERARQAVVSAFGESRFETLTAFLAFVRTAHFWTETHPNLEYEPDMVALMAKHDELARLLLDRTEAERRKAGDTLRRTLAELQVSRGERQKVEEALRISEERLRAVLHTARMASWEWDPAADAIGASDTMDDLFGLPAGAKFQTRSQGYGLVHPEDVSGHRDRSAAAAKGGGTWHHNFRIIRPSDGQVAWLEEHAHAALDSNTGKLSVAGLVWDVTDRKTLEMSLQATDRRKDEFLAILAHELRNPLASLRNGLQIARLTSHADSSFQRTIAMMDRQLTRLVRLVDDLLDVGRINSGKVELRRTEVTLRDVLISSAEAARPAIDARDHELIIGTDAEELWVRGDFDRLTQIFTNLLTNAAKYTERGGRIELQVTRDTDWGAVSVTDNGIGIPADDLLHIFDMFSQVRLHQGHSEGGLGIGLSVVRNLVEMHQGTVSAASVGTGKGSTFIVRLPLVRGNESRGPASVT